ncbi:unnamed protein product [Cylindrotheca closterium]|uniref:PA domain-containing protein n=1 Tax=Cylindrotheca closterium TaxID=2856 RepID=A0AAD2CPT4_9STRA|nr:unnamed protein product [Cylindrotheca closterium]
MRFLPFALAAAALLASTEAADEASRSMTSRLMVHIPHSLFRGQGYDHREALFGTPPHGGSIAQPMYYAASDACDTLDPKRGYKARAQYNTPWQSPFILMVRNAQRAGAAGVIIADNVCLCTDPECKNQQGTTCEASVPIMADDGSGSDVSIPSFLIFKKDADLIKAELQKNNPVQLEMSWSLPNPNDRVEYDLWTVPTDSISKTFMQNFRPLANALGSHAQFTPHMESLGPSDVVRESLRRICIWNNYGEEDGVGDPWWGYVSEFTAHCDTPEYFTHDDCVNDAYRYAAIDADAISRCMRDSGGTEGDSDNSYLKMAVSSQSERGVVVLPSVFVNNLAIRGKMSSTSIFQAVCAEFAEGTEPPICNTCSRCPDAIGCVASGVCSGIPYNSAARGGGGASLGMVSTHTFAFWMFFVVCSFGGVGYWAYNKIREDLGEQAREYTPVNVEDSGNPKGYAWAPEGDVPQIS